MGRCPLENIVPEFVLNQVRLTRPAGYYWSSSTQQVLLVLLDCTRCCFQDLFKKHVACLHNYPVAFSLRVSLESSKYIYIIYIYIYIYIYLFIYLCVCVCECVCVRGSFNKFPDVFRMGPFIDSTHMKLESPSK